MKDKKQNLENLLKFFLLIFPQLHIEDTVRIEQISKLITPFFLQPLPIGGIAKNILTNIKNEVIRPGQAMRERFERAVIKLKDLENSNEIRDFRRTGIFINI